MKVTGVSGFIGSSVARKCSENGYEVIGITRSSPAVVSRELGINVIQADLNDINNLELETADTIVHCATPNEILSKNLSAGLSLSIVGTSKILEASRRAKIYNVIFFSTAQVYGTELNGYYDETTPVDCKTFYGINHYLGEQLCKFYCETLDFNITILRPSNTYGVPDLSIVNRRTLVPMCFIDEAINNDTITLRSSGKQMRNFVSLEQVAEATIRIIENFPKGYSVRNCASNFYSSILNIANIVANQYLKNFKKKLIINVKSEQPKISNTFEYTSKFNKFFDTQLDCLRKMDSTIDKLFKLWKKNI